MIQKDTDIPMSMAALFTTAKTWKPKCATIDELIKEKWCVCVCVCVCVCIHIYNGILLSHKKNEIMPFAATWMDLEHTKQSKSERQRQIPYAITYVWNMT